MVEAEKHEIRLADFSQMRAPETPPVQLAALTPLDEVHHDAKEERNDIKTVEECVTSELCIGIAKTGAWLTQMLQGHLNYYAVSGNGPSLWWYFNEVRWRWIKSVKRENRRDSAPRSYPT